MSALLRKARPRVPRPARESAAAAWHLAITSRASLGMDLGALRRQRRYLELGTDDLAFSEDEARAALAEAGVELSDERVQAWVRRTEGWPAGIYLMALTLRDGRNRAAVARSISDDFGMTSSIPEQPSQWPASDEVSTEELARR